MTIGYSRSINSMPSLQVQKQCNKTIKTQAPTGKKGVKEL